VLVAGALYLAMQEFESDYFDTNYQEERENQ